MTTNEILHLLTSFGKRLATLADQAHETREQAQHTLDRICLLREDVEQLKRRLLAGEVPSDDDTHVPLRSDVRK